jgi:hypothetical protein
LDDEKCLPRMALLGQLPVWKRALHQPVSGIAISGGTETGVTFPNRVRFYLVEAKAFFHSGKEYYADNYRE